MKHQFSSRLVPDRPFPSYTYVPGRNPHPVSDPAGHSFQKTVTVGTALDPSKWDECSDFLFGLDLFNYGYFWEAHEIWEGLWHLAGRRGLLATFLKGLIKLAAAGVKIREGKPQGRQSLASAAAGHFREVQTIIGQNYCGFNLDELAQITDYISQGGEQGPSVQLLPNSGVRSSHAP